MSAPTRRERDPLGIVEVPADALYGAQTARAVANFPISGLRPDPAFIDAVVRIKRAAASVHRGTGRLDAARADAIIAAADAVLGGAHRDQFVVDVFQAGAGTSLNMNVNEVLATLATRALGDAVHPNDHVNMAQSTNDVIPTAIRLATLDRLRPALAAVDALAATLRQRAVEFDGLVKAGRTHLQDAMPIRLGQEVAGWAGSLERGARRVREAADYLLDLGIGGTAVGTGVNAEPVYAERMVVELTRLTDFPLREGADRVQLMQSMGDVAAVSAAWRVLALDLGKIASDLRLLASGPRTGLDELRLPAVQPGSSIMPGKVNPSIPEMVNQVVFQVVGHDATVSAAAEQGQLELNVMMPVIGHNVLSAIRILGNAAAVLDERTVRGMQANSTMLSYWVERSAALATALAPRIGYAEAAALTKRSVESGESIRTLVLREGLLTPEEADRLLDLARMTEPGVPGQDA
ncbi:aspartate ammonia-lyase [Pseudogemmatithrix spongiicola]|uniref:Aspartate ammonia-lyase n=1 Tax=Pseudogemmatithrix spongiicola TaxID=3062599 RepID=A0AA49JVE7_9BACT|nr:aspartate ammonia-lyase [Gemmatimonadaceae bacterium 'strain 138']WKW15464.1 aspartate ammonia-lyase [Gemmatimonadaceae bacterium 'strain 318']